MAVGSDVSFEELKSIALESVGMMDLVGDGALTGEVDISSAIESIGSVSLSSSSVDALRNAGISAGLSGMLTGTADIIEGVGEMESSSSFSALLVNCSTVLFSSDC